MILIVVAVKQRYKLKSNSQQLVYKFASISVVAVKQRYKLKSNSQRDELANSLISSCCCKAKIQT